MDSAETLRLRHSIRVLKGDSTLNLTNEFERLGMVQQEIVPVLAGGEFFVLKAENLPAAACSFLKQELLSAGADAAISPRAGAGETESLSLIATGNLRQFQKLHEAGNGAPQDLPAWSSAFMRVIEDYRRTDHTITYPGGSLDLSRKTAIMGIVNVTPDSFSDGGDCFQPEDAVAHGLEMVEGGADIIDIGGESTRPGSDPVSADEELRRVIPVIEKLSSQTSRPVSVDTYKPGVAEEAIAAGARMVNNIAGLPENPRMAEVILEHGVPTIIMHMKGKPRTMQQNPEYEDLMLEIYSYLARCVEVARSYGIGLQKLIVDPGIGFGKTFDDNLVILNRIHELRSLGLPVCAGVSRKAFIGAVLGIGHPKERLIGSIAASVIAIRGGARIVRVHDVKEVVQAAKVADAISAQEA